MPKKGRKLMLKSSKKGAKMGSKINEKLIEFRKWWFFDFCYTSAVKTSKFKVQGSQNQPKIHQKSMQKSCRKMWCKKVGKWSQNGSKMGAKIGAKSEKDGKRVLQNRCKKMMRKMEGSWNQPLASLNQPLASKECFWSRRGGKEGTSPSGTGGIGFELLRSENALHPAGCGGYFLMKKRSLGAKGSIYSLILVVF